MAQESRVNQARILAENRQLRNALETLLDEVDGNGPVDCECVRDQMPDPPGHGDREDEGIDPPWVRDGYEDKQAWLADKRGD